MDNRIPTLEDKKEELSLIDITKQLCIHQFMNQYQSDILVRDYADSLLELKMLPILPSQEDLEMYLNIDVTIVIPLDLQQKLVNNFMRYFQVKYFKNNLHAANLAEKQLFNPRNNFWVPGYELFPARILTNLNELKVSYVNDVQVETEKGAIFVLENMILRNYKFIVNFIKHELMCSDDQQCTKLFQHILAMTYQTAKLEFAKNYSVKVIDWTAYQSKTKESLPRWRLETPGQPPVEKVCKVAESTMTKLQNNQTDFNREVVSANLKHFMDNPFPEQKFQSNSSYNSFNHRRGSYQRRPQRGFSNSYRGRGQPRMRNTGHQNPNSSNLDHSNQHYSHQNDQYYPNQQRNANQYRHPPKRGRRRMEASGQPKVNTDEHKNHPSSSKDAVNMFT